MEGRALYRLGKAWGQMAFWQLWERQSGVAVRDIEENIAEWEVYRRCPPAENVYGGFFPRSGSRTMALYHSTMWRTVTSQSFSVTFIYRFRNRECGGQISIVERNKRKGFTLASMLYQALFTAPNEGIFTIGLHGITGGNILQSGGTAPVWSIDGRNAMHQPFRSWICRMRW